jgi:hypothetical protein
MSKSSFYASTGPGTSELELLDWYLAQITAIYNLILAIQIDVGVSEDAAAASATQASGYASDAADSAADAAASAAAAEAWYDLMLGITSAAVPESIIIACSDESTALTTGTAKVTFRLPYNMTLQGIRASLTTAQTAGSLFTVDGNVGGVSLLTTRVTLDNTETTSVTAATAPVLLTTALYSDNVITVDIDQLGDGTAKGLKVYLMGVRA